MNFERNDTMGRTAAEILAELAALDAELRALTAELENEGYTLESQYAGIGDDELIVKGRSEKA